MFKKILFLMLFVFSFTVQAEEVQSGQNTISTMQADMIKRAGDDSPATRTLNQIQLIQSAVDSFAISSGSYAGIDTLKVIELVSANNMKSVTGGNIGVANGTEHTYFVAIPLTTPICDEVKAKLATNKSYINLICHVNGMLSYTYSNV